ncbi:MAG TPA: hypothetical protein PLG41_07460 [Leptospiraceae bacterium]|nr:hypothetical protein [Leptospiraceae bacterium]
MISLDKLLSQVINKDNFKSIEDYIEFCNSYLKYIATNLQAVIVSQNESQYRFFQYNESAGFQITRPINSNLMYSAKDFSENSKLFLGILKKAKSIKPDMQKERETINRTTYTIQQSIGAALDGLPAGESNKARKLNGDFFERFIRLILQKIGINCKSDVIQIPVLSNENEILFHMSYQHDLVVQEGDEIKLIGSVKTSSKDRIDKIFIDKFLYARLTGTNVPHIAIFLNDVQRKNTKTENEYGINSTFLPGHFKGYTIKLNPLDGVYYCDIRPNMLTENILKDHIKTFDKFLCDDIWNFI